MARSLRSGDEIVQRLVRGRLGREDEIGAGVRDQLGDGLTGEQVVAQIDRTQRRDPCVVIVEPALDGVALAILLLGAVLRRDELGHQGNDLGMAGRDDGRRQKAMIMLGLAVGAFAGQTVRAAELL